MFDLPLWKRNLIICWIGSFSTLIGIYLVVPFLPLYISQLGVQSLPEIEKWSGYTLGAPALVGMFTMPLWGKLSDRYGCKPMLLRASLGMAVTMFAMGFVRDVYQLLFLRLLMGGVMGFVPAAITMVASQTPKEKTGWALATLSTGSVSGALVGPLIGGVLSDLLGLRPVFFCTGVCLFLAFLVTLWGIHEEFVPKKEVSQSNRPLWKTIARPQVLIAIFLTTSMLQLATMSIQPILTIYVEQLMQRPSHISMVAGAVFAATGVANILIAPSLGRLSDRIGSHKVLRACLILSALTIIPQAFVHTVWQLTFLRFLFGLTAAGLMPSINTMIRKNVPSHSAGAVYGYNSTFSNLGSLSGPILGGHIAAAFGIPAVFFSTSLLLLLNAFWVFSTKTSYELSASK
ncbi:MAG: multidrug efflux MFS transporter [Peptococcaceae bacterium]|jgi:MFS family permease|nr:multidrug efflux MFS transporter [Peptococcaceae bacterium]